MKYFSKLIPPHGGITPFPILSLIGISPEKLLLAAGTFPMFHPPPIHLTGLHLPISSLEITLKAFLLFNPPWSTNFHKDKMTLTCRGSLSLPQGDISWYCNENLLNKKSEEIQIDKTGYYKCKTQRSSLSDPIHVDFSLGEKGKGVVSEPKPLGSKSKGWTNAGS